MDENTSQELIEAMNRLTDALGSAGASANSFGGAAKAAAGEAEEARKAQAAARKKQKEEEEKALANFKAALTAAGGSVVSFGKALTTVDAKFSSLGDGMDKAGDAALELGKNFGVLGTAVGLAVKAITSVATASFKQADAALEAKDSLTKLGGVGVGTGEQIIKMANASGISSKNLNALVKPIQSLSGSFQILGNTVGEGQQAFMKITQVSKEQRAEFGRLGFSQEQLIQSQADYIKLQALSGKNIQSQAKDADKLRASSLEYTKNLLELAAITGQDLEGAKKAKEFAANQYAEVLRTRQEDDKVRELEKKMASTKNEQERKAIEEEIAQTKFRQQSRKDLVASAKNVIGEKEAAALAQAVATGMIGPGMEGLITKGIDPIALKMKLDSAKTEAERKSIIDKELKSMVDKTGQAVKSFGKTASFMDSATQDALGVGIDAVKQTGQFAGKDFEEARKTAAAAIKKQGEAGADPMADAREQLRATQVALATGLDDLLLKVNPLKLAFGGLATATGGLILAIGAASKALKGLAGTGGSGIGAGAAKMGTGILKGGGLAIAGAAGEMAGDYLKEKGHEKAGTAVGVAGQAAGWAGTGAMLGSVVPGLGTAVGAGIGGAAGLLKGLYDNREALLGNTKATKENSQETKETEKASDTKSPAAPAAGPAAPAAKPAGAPRPAAPAPAAPARPAAAPARPAASSGGGAGGGGAGSGSASAAAPRDSGDASKTPAPGADELPKVRKASGGSMSEQEAKAMTMKHEGVRLEPYKDSLGLWTVGVGHLIGNGKTLPPEWNRKFSQEEIMALYDKDYEEHKKAAQSNVPGFGKFDSLGQAALVDLTFNMGPNWSKKFPNTSKKLGMGDAEGAAAGLMDSAWFGQVKSRGPTIVEMVRNSKVSARDGGIASGPDSGYPATLHGKEMITPITPNSIIEKLAKTSMTGEITGSKTHDSSEVIATSVAKMTGNLSERLDKIASLLEVSHHTQEKTLRAVRS